MKKCIADCSGMAINAVMNIEWFVLSEGQQLGPYSGELLVQYAQEGRIAAETLVWAEGMAEWLPAAQIPGLFPEAPVAAVKPVLATGWAPPGARTSAVASAPASASPYTTPSSSLAPHPVGGSYPFLSIKPASFGLWMWSILGGVLCFILMIVFFVMAGTASESAVTDEAKQAVATKAMLGAVMYGLCLLCMLLSMIFFYINLYRAWSCLRAGAPRTTPGQAIGMLFIPFYNLYWIFVAIAGLPKDWNRIVSSYDDLQTAPRLSETMFLMFCIGSLVFAPLALFVMFPMMSQICKGVNFFAYRRNSTSPSGLSPAGFGGIKFG